MRTYVFFFFSLDTLFLHCDSKPCTHYWYIYWGCYYIISPITSCIVSFLSLCTCFLFIVCNLLFLFHTKIPWWVLFKVFQKYRLSKSFMLWTLFLHSFSRVCIMIDFIVFNKWVWVGWVITSLIFHLFVVVLSRIAKGEIIRIYVNHVKNICHLELDYNLTKRTLLVIW